MVHLGFAYGTSGPKTVTQFFNVMNIIWTR